MTVGLEDQIRDYAHNVHETEMPLTVYEITEMRLGTESVRPIGPLSHPADLRPHRRWLVAVAAAVVVLGLLGSFTLLSQVTDPDTSPVAGPVVPTTVTQPTQTTVAEGVSGDVPGCEIPSGWLQVCDPASFNGTDMYAVTAGGPGLVAVGANGLEYYTLEGDADLGGYEGEAPVGTGDAVVWTSPDGFTWTRVPHDVDTFGGVGGQQMFGVTVGGPGLVAVGRDGPVADGEGSAAVWTSPDGFTWSRVPHDDAIFGGLGEQRMISVTAGASGLVAVGFDRPAKQGEGNAVVWTSPDGFVWSRVPHDEAVFGGDSRQIMLSVTTGGPGLVAVGTDGYSYQDDDDYQHVEIPDELAADAAVWTSPDGFTWSRVPHDDAIFGGLGEQRMEGVTAGGPGLVAVGSVTGELVGRYAFDAAVWTSPDGFAWSRVPHDEDVFATSGEQYPAGAHEEQMLSVTAGGPGLVAVGFDSVDDCGWDSAVWTSPNGLNWSRVPDERDCNTPGNGPYDRMLSVTVGPSGLVAVGEEHGPGGAAAVWNG
jgi:hypothetical protein